MNHALQTRAATLPFSAFKDVDTALERAQLLIERGYNTLVLPVMQDGELAPLVTSEGSQRRTRCRFGALLEELSELPASLWLQVDFLSAGTGRLGKFARANRPWLMRNMRGNFEALGEPPAAGFFCWTSLEYRRFLGAVLVDLVDGYRVDGLVMDLRPFRETTTDPRTWMHFGFSSLARMQRELGLQIEDYLVRPSMERFKEIERWRVNELMEFLEAMKVRTQRVRDQLPFLAMTRFGREQGATPPWVAWYERGLIDEAIVSVTPETLVHEDELLESLLDEPHPLGFAFASEEHALSSAKDIVTHSASGFVCEDPPVTGEPLPATELTWEREGSLENHPVEACLVILRFLAAKFENTKRLKMFFQRPNEFIEALGGSIRAEDALRLRKDFLRIERIIGDPQYEFAFDRGEVLQKLRLMARLLLLTPAPAWD